MRFLKRMIAILLSILLIISAVNVLFYVYAESNDTDNINLNLLESVLSERSWIIDTLINGDLSTNPYNAVNSSSNSRLLMDDVLENYQNDDAFKLVVDAMEYYSESGDYLRGFGDEILSGLMGLLGLSSEDGVIGTIDKLSRSTAEIKFESILNDILTEDYEASWGETLQDSNAQLENLRQLSKFVKKLSKYQKAINDLYNIDRSDTYAITVYKDPLMGDISDYDISVDDYVGHFLDAYSQDLEEYIKTTEEIPSLTGNASLKKKVVGLALFGAVSIYNGTLIPDKNDNRLTSVFYDQMFDDAVKNTLSGAGKALKAGENTANLALLMGALLAQKDSLVATLNRVAENTTDEDLKKVIRNYSDLAESVGNDKIVSFESITTYLRQNTPITNFIGKKLKSTFKGAILESAYAVGGIKDMVLADTIATGIGETMALLKIGVWVANYATGIEDTAKKIFVLKNVQKLLNRVIPTYRSDLKNYRADKTDANAKKVLDDLDFIKAIRLYGEKTAYGSITKQTDSWVGILLGGDNVADYLEEEYAAQVDSLLGCKFSPINYIPFTISNGATLSIVSETVNGREYTVARCRDIDGTNYAFPEADLLLLGGVNIGNNSTLNILKAPSGFYLPYLTCKGNCTVNINSENVGFGTVENNDSLIITYKNDMQVTDTIVNKGRLELDSNFDAECTCYDIKNSSSLILTDKQLNAKGNVQNNGSVTGILNICGDNTEYIENSYYKTEGQFLYGSGTYSDLAFNNFTQKGVQIYGTHTVTNSISNSSSRLRTSENIYLTGKCSIVNNRFKGSLSFRNYSTSQPVAIDGYGCMYGSNTFGGNTVFNDGLMLTDSCQTLTLNGTTEVKGDLLYKAGTINGSDWLKISGDMSITASSPSISNLDFTGLTPQSISSSNSLIVTQLDSHNLSLSGVEFESKIYVTGRLKSDRMTKFFNGKNVTLTGNAVCESESLRGSISAENWNCTRDTAINGTLFASGNITLNNGITLNVSGYNQSSGTLTVNENSVLNCKGDYVQSGTTSNNGTIQIDGDSLINGAMMGGELIVKGDVNAAAEISLNRFEFNSRTPQCFSNSSSTQTDILELNNSSLTGITINSVITVNQNYINHSNKVINSENIVFHGNGSEVLQKDFTIGGTYTVESGTKLIVDGKLNLKSGANLIIEDGAELVVKRSTISSGASISVAENGKLNFGGYFSGANTIINSDGEIQFKDDTLLSGCTLGGSGTIAFSGDLETSSCTWQNPNVHFRSRLPQIISGSEINANNLTITNTSKSGLKLNTTVYYYGVLETETSEISGSDKLIAR